MNDVLAPEDALSAEIEMWLESMHRSLDALDEALQAQAKASRRLSTARDALEDIIGELYADGAITGASKDVRDACLHRLTAAERFELGAAEEALESFRLEVEHTRTSVTKNRATRHALQLRVALQTGAISLLTNGD